jgi:hypothetical protein
MPSYDSGPDILSRIAALERRIKHLEANPGPGWSSAWDGVHAILGSYHIWIDATGDVRIKSSAPTSDTDGAIIGTQS